jgi:hypothetical protein
MRLNFSMLIVTLCLSTPAYAQSCIAYREVIQENSDTLRAIASNITGWLDANKDQLREPYARATRQALLDGIFAAEQGSLFQVILVSTKEFNTFRIAFDGRMNSIRSLTSAEHEVGFFKRTIIRLLGNDDQIAVWVTQSEVALAKISRALLDCLPDPP